MSHVCKAVEEIGTAALSGVTGRKLTCEIRLPVRFHEDPPHKQSVGTRNEISSSVPAKTY
jgi:hypothetical protein